MKVATCSIIKQENLYIREFVEYNKKIGFDNVIIYDHNEGDENVRDVIGDYIDDGFVILIDWSGHKIGPAVMEAFDDCIKTYKHQNIFDWILFCDNDEFLNLVQDNNVKEYLSRKCFDNIDLIKINWMNMSDNNLLNYENKLLNQRFIKPCRENPLKFKENWHIKTFVKISSPNIDFIDYLHGGPHCPCRFYNGQRVYGTWIKELKAVDNAGNLLGYHNQTRESKINYINYDLAYLKHFRFKTIEEHCKNKLEKLSFKGYTSCNFGLQLFYRYNDFNIEKTKYFNNYLNQKYPLKVALFVTVKHSEFHLIEYINYYINLGIDKIFLIDNNESNYSVDVNSIIEKNQYLKEYIEYIDAKDKYELFINNIYQDIYDKEKNNYDWFCIFGINDYLNIKNYISIKQFLTNENENNIFEIYKKINCNLTIEDFLNNEYFKYVNARLDELYENTIYIDNTNCNYIFKSKINNLKINNCIPNYDGQIKKYLITKENNNIFSINYKYKCPYEYIHDYFTYNKITNKENCIGDYISNYIALSFDLRGPFIKYTLGPKSNEIINEFFNKLNFLFDNYHLIKKNL